MAAQGGRKRALTQTKEILLPVQLDLQGNSVYNSGVAAARSGTNSAILDGSPTFGDESESETKGRRRLEVEAASPARRNA